MNWEQLKAVLWLRWRLTRNQWRRGGNIGAVLAALLIATAITAAVVLLAAGILVGVFLLSKSTPFSLLMLWDVLIGVFLMMWMVGLLTELQRSETIDLQRLMHLPVKLGQLFTINYIASHFVLSVIACVPVIIGLAIGLSISHSPAMLLLLPLSLSCVFMVTAWTYCLRGWLAALMANPRRRRSIVLGITVAFIAISQLPNLYFNVLARQSKPRVVRNTEEVQQVQRERGERDRRGAGTFLAVHPFVPPMWVALGAKNIAEHRSWPALLGMLGCAAIGALGLRRAYGATVRFYRGGGRSKPGRTPAPKPAAAYQPGAVAAPMLVEKSLPWVSNETASVALATFRSMLRAPEVKMAWATTVLVTLIFAATTVFRAGPKAPAEAKPFIVTGLLAMLLFMLVQSLANQFGFDRGGFRAFVLAPIRRRHLLLGKNLANVPVAFVLAGITGAVAVFWLKMSWSAALAVPFQFVTMFLLSCALGNVLSIVVPYKVQHGSMKPTKVPAKAAIVMFFTHMLFPTVMLPAFLPPLAQLLWDLAKLPSAPVGLLLAIIIASAAAAGYWFSLQPLERLMRARELKILEILASDVE